MNMPFASSIREGAEQASIVDAAIQSDSYLSVRRRICRQLIEALLFEGVIGAETTTEDGVIRFRIAGQDERGEPVHYLCQGHRRHTFGRIRLTDAPVLRMTSGECREADSPARFLLEIRSMLGADDTRLASFINELEHTLLNDTLAQHIRRQEQRTLRGGSYDELEGDVMDGHPYHPSYKSRIGFDVADQLQYGPEFKQELRPVWVAVAKADTRFAVSRGSDVDRVLAGELGEEQLAAFQEAVKARRVDPADYWFLPVHPWQWQKVASAFLEEVRERRLIPLGVSPDAYRAQQSIRTLANRTSPDKAYLKLSMSLINTSTGRILAPHTVANAPAISDWLHELAAADAFLRDESRVVLLREIMGICYDRPSRSELLQAQTYGVLGCIWRESLHRYLEPGEAAVPFNALISVDLDGRPLVEPWIRRFGIEPWLTRLFEASILPVVHFLYAHGIALESHAQNMVLVHRDGWPERVALKDFHDGVRFSRAHLAEPEKCPALFATPEYHARVNRNSFIETDDPAAVRDFMHDAFFFINIGELALFLADAYGFDERTFWRRVHEVIERYQQRFAPLADRFRLFDLFAPSIEVEQLAKRRLFPDTELRVHRVQNPLALSDENA